MGYKIWIGPKKTAKGTESRAAAQAECDRANEPIDERRILALAALDWHRSQAEPLVGAAAVRELTEPLSAESRALLDAGLKSGRKEPAVSLGSFTADVENDGDRGPRAFRDPLSVLDQAADAARAKAVQRLMAAVGALSVDEVAALAWVAGELPGAKLRRKCEEATATGWCGSDITKDPPAGRSEPVDRTRSAVLGAWRQVVALVHGAHSSASEDLRQRTREHVLADEARRRAGGAK